MDRRQCGPFAPGSGARTVGDGLRSEFGAKLRKRGLSVERQVAIPIEYEGHRFDEEVRADLVFEGKVVVELKSVEKIHPAHEKQLLTYLRLTGMKPGYLLNFGEALMKDGITRIVHGEL